MLRILIVDDEKKSRELLDNLFSKLLPDPVIAKACNYREAMEMLQTCPFDMLLTDICMPDTDGLSMIEEILRLDLHLFFVVVSAFDRFDYARKAIELGVNAYVLKPVYSELIEDVLEKYREFQKNAFPSRTMVFQKSNGSLPVKIGDILAVEVQDKCLLKIYHSDGTENIVYGKLGEVYADLSGCFTHINRQCIMNISLIRSFDSTEGKITAFSNGEEMIFPVSRECNKKMKKLFRQMSNFSAGYEEETDI
jgi:DNA-binding LytR/AlgR family response regulator